MLLTEKEAQQQWCPFSRVARASKEPDGTDRVSHGQAVYNRAALDNANQVGWPAAANCIGSHCMAWQWSEQAEAAETGEPLGYCGLAGKPET